MSISLFESRQYVLKQAIQSDENSLVFDDASKISVKILEILKNYPHLNNSDQMGDALTKVRNKIQRILPDFETDEFKLFSKLVDHPITTITCDNTSLKVSSSVLVFRSERTQGKWESELANDLPILCLEDWSWEEVLIAIHYMETGEAHISTENSWHILALADFLMIPKLAETAEGVLLDYYAKMQKVNGSEMSQIVTLLNDPRIDRHPRIKSKFESLITEFFKISFRNMSHDYCEVKSELKKLTNSISLDFNGQPLTDFHLAQLKKLPLHSLNLKNCSKLTPNCNQILNQMGHLTSLDLSGNTWLKDEFLTGLTSLTKLKELNLTHTLSTTGGKSEFFDLLDT